MILESSSQIFFDLLRAGLWEKEVRLSAYRNVSFEGVFTIAREQSVIGLITAGLERVVGVKVPQEAVLTIAGEVLQLEQRNVAMNQFIGKLIEKLRKADVYALLVKGQGIGQYYERPLWRASGDVDLLLSKDNLVKAKSYLASLTTAIEEDKQGLDHFSMQIGHWEVELHGSLRGGLWKHLDSTIDRAQDEVFYGGNVRSWMVGHTQVFLPAVDEDVIFVFTHILQHFFKEGIGLRQLCDWCRLLWTYRDKLDVRLLESRIKQAGIMSEWRAFAALAVDWLGMPVASMPFYDSSKKWERKAELILQRIMKTGNFGHNRDMGYYQRRSVVVTKLISLWYHTSGNIECFLIFPMDSLRAWWSMVKTGVVIVLKGK